MAASDSCELLTVHERIQLFIDALPVLSHDELASLAQDTCPICLVPFSALNHPETRGIITKLSQCGHVFCRKDLAEWIRGQHGSCPTCRHKFMNVAPPSESDDESSDGGEYMPPSDDFEDEDDGFLDTDGFTDADAEDYAEYTLYDDVVPLYEAGVDEDLDMEDDGNGEWGLTGDSGSMSDGPSLEIDPEPDSAPDLVQSLEYEYDEAQEDIRYLDYSEAK